MKSKAVRCESSIEADTIFPANDSSRRVGENERRCDLSTVEKICCNPSVPGWSMAIGKKWRRVRGQGGHALVEGLI
eukprot:CAMPEP_0180172556 /NCGR_PEP_ID=MMETSP0986-20121125/35094_1 /TAXON_ID=697907 /ORGANISM="non described non described, Strain CCMP2293" /LENGTH=75 /DNA_ID=CAMNT_0022124663 /DNA_START=408 /DNA_END=632 /DNA_ORIENTATION=-